MLLRFGAWPNFGKNPDVDLVALVCGVGAALRGGSCPLGDFTESAREFAEAKGVGAAPNIG